MDWSSVSLISHHFASSSSCPGIKLKTESNWLITACPHFQNPLTLFTDLFSQSSQLHINLKPLLLDLFFPVLPFLLLLLFPLNLLWFGGLLHHIFWVHTNAKKKKEEESEDSCLCNRKERGPNFYIGVVLRFFEFDGCVDAEESLGVPPDNPLSVW